MFVVPLVFDVIGTVTGQEKSYWKTHFKEFKEAVPGAHILLKMHPLLFIVVCLALWLPVTYLLVKALPTPFNLWCAMALFGGHTYNSVHWLRSTQKTWGILTGKDRVSMTLSLIPMTVYIIAISAIATAGIYFFFILGL